MIHYEKAWKTIYIAMLRTIFISRVKEEKKSKRRALSSFSIIIMSSV